VPHAAREPDEVPVLLLTDAKRRLLDALKRADELGAADLAARFGLSEAAVRQHLSTLEGAGLVVRSVVRGGGRGRPGLRWRLSELAHDLFPDRHADLTVDLIGSIREAVGDEGLQKVIDARTARQLAAYQAVVPAPGRASLRARVQALAAQRSAEGYLAEVVDEGRDGVVLVEHHCPICDAASACQGLCRSELEVFAAVLGPGVSVERERHRLSGDERCAYRIRPIRGLPRK
jgi:predicted ArsR family transcriptional regulator